MNRNKILVVISLFLILAVDIGYSDTIEDFYNNLIGPSAKYDTFLSKNYLRNNTSDIDVDSKNGSLTVTQTDFVLSGRNGLDVELTRIYKSKLSDADNMKAESLNGAIVDVVESGVDAISFVENRYNLGVATRFSFPTIEILGDEKYLHTESGAIFRLINRHVVDNNYTYDIESHPAKDFSIWEDTSINQGHVDDQSKFMKLDKDGKKTYFSNDGRILIVKDRYGNQITFEYEDFDYTLDGTAIERRLITKIIDTVGREFNFEYNEDLDHTVIVNGDGTFNDDIGSIFNVVVYLPDDTPMDLTNNPKLVYEKKVMMYSDTTNKVLRTQLSDVYDMDGSHKYSFIYEQNGYGRNEGAAAGFTYTHGNSYTKSLRSEILTGIDYPEKNRRIDFTYGLYTKSMGSAGSLQYRKVESVEHKSRSLNEQTNQTEYNLEKKIDYSYINEPDGYGTSGYQTSTEYLKNTFKYYTTKTDLLGYKVKFTYNGLHEQENVEKSGPDHKIVSVTTFDEYSFPEMKVTTVHERIDGSDTGKEFSRYENFDYDEYGNLLEYTSPRAQRDVNGNPIGSKFSGVYIRLDGETDDWDGIEKIGTGNLTTEFIKVAQDDTLFNILIEGISVGTNPHIIIDADNNPSTGFKTYKWGDSGGDYLIEGTKLYEFVGSTQNEYLWNEIDTLVPHLSDDRIEITLQQSKIGNTSAKDMKIGYWNSAVTIPKTYSNMAVAPADGHIYNEYTVVYEYARDKFHQLKSKTWKNDTESFSRTEYQIDAIGNVTEEKRIHEENGLAKNIVTTYNYDTYGNLIQETTDSIFTTNYEYGIDFNGSDQKGAYLTKEYWSVEGQEQSVKHAYDFYGGIRTGFKDELGYVTAYEYDDLFRLVTQTYPNNSTESYTYSDGYNENSTMTSINRSGVRTIYTYNIFGDMIKYQEDVTVDGVTTLQTFQEVEYNSNGYKTKEIDFNGNSTRFEYDSDNRLISKEFYLNDLVFLFKETMTYKFSDDENMPLVIEVTDQEGFKRKDYYNRLSELVKSEAEFEEGQFTQSFYAYDYSGNMKSTTDANGNTLLKSYDDLNQLIRQTNALNETTRFEYNSRGLLVKTIHPNEHEVKKEYDVRGRLIKEIKNNTNGIPVTTRFIYDAKGRIVKTILPNSYDPTREGTADLLNLPGESAVYDVMDNVIEKYLADGTLYEKNYYNADDSLRKTVNGNVNTGVESDFGFIYTYNNQGDVARVTDPLGNETVYTYDLMGNQLTETDKLGRVTASEYDALGRLVKTIYPDGATIQQEYDDKGNVVKQVDALGNTTSFSYDGLNRLIQTSFEDGSVIEYVYDGNGNMTAKKQKNGAVIEYSYDELDRLEQKKTPLYNNQNEIIYSIESQMYNDMGQVVSKTLTGTQDPSEKRVATNVYFQNGLLEYSVAPSGGKTFYEYDNNGNVVEKAVERSSGQYNTTKFEYNENNLLVVEKRLMEKWPLYDFQQYLDIARLVDDEDADKILIMKGYEYDTLGNIVKIVYPKAYMYDDLDRVNRDNYSEFFEYDLLNRLTKKMWYDSGLLVFEETTYDKMDNVLTVTNAAGFTKAYDYDLRNRKIQFKDEYNQVTQFEYDLNGNMTSVTNAKNQTIYSSFDSLNRLIETKNDNLVVTGRNVYNLAGQLIKKIDAEGYKSGVDDDSRYGMEYTYDLSGRIASQLDPEAKEDGLLATISNEYNQFGEISKSIDANNSSVQYVYDKAGYLVKTIDSVGNETIHTYDYLGNTESTTDGNGHTTEYLYHDQNVLYTQTDADDNQMVFRYDISLNTVAIRTKNANTIQQSYDNLGRLVHKFNNNGEDIYYEYDVLGNRTKMIDDSGVTEYLYDNKSQLLMKKIDGTPALTYAYDVIGNKLSTTDNDGIVTSFLYDSENRLVSATTTKGSSNYVSTYTYDANGNRLTYTDASSGIRTTYGYNKNNQLVSQVSYDAGNETIFDGTYIYDNAGNQLSKNEDGQITTLVYDGLNRVQDIIYPNGDTVFYTYDGAGNRLTEIQDLDSSGTEYINNNVYNYEKIQIDYRYTNANKLLNTTSKYLDGQGVELFRKVKDHYYDDNGNDIQEVSSTILQDIDAPAFDISTMTSMSQQIHPAFVLNEHVRKLYDGYNRAVEFETVKPTGITIAKIAYNGDNLRVSRQVENVKDAKVESIRYLYDGAYVIREEVSGQTERPNSLRYIVGTSYVGHIDSNENIQFYLYNGHGDTVGVFDAAGNILNTYEYDIFGKSTLSTENTYETHIRYAGEYYDSDTGFYYLRARYYNPVTARFVNEDSVWGKKHQPLSLNLYTYAYNNPVRFIDPSGHVVTDWERTNLSKSDQKKVARFGQAWTKANENYSKAKTTAEKNKYKKQMDQAHSYAKKIREANITDNSRVQSNGYVVNSKVKQDVATGKRNEYSDAGILNGKYEKQNSGSSSNSGSTKKSSSGSTDRVDNSKTSITGNLPVVNNISQKNATQEAQELVDGPSINSDVSGLIVHKTFTKLDEVINNKESMMDVSIAETDYQGAFYEGDGESEDRYTASVVTLESGETILRIADSNGELLPDIQIPYKNDYKISINVEIMTRANPEVWSEDIDGGLEAVSKSAGEISAALYLLGNMNPIPGDYIDFAATAAGGVKAFTDLNIPAHTGDLKATINIVDPNRKVNETGVIADYEIIDYVRFHDGYDEYRSYHTKDNGWYYPLFDGFTRKAYYPSDYNSMDEIEFR